MPSYARTAETENLELLLRIYNSSLTLELLDLLKRSEKYEVTKTEFVKPSYRYGTTHTCTGASDKELLIQSYQHWATDKEILTPSYDGDADREQLMQIHWYADTNTKLLIRSYWLGEAF